MRYAAALVMVATLAIMSCKTNEQKAAGCMLGCHVVALGTSYACDKIPSDPKYDAERKLCEEGKPQVDPVCVATCQAAYPKK